MRATLILAAVVLLMVAPNAGAETFVDDFEGGANETGWAFIQGGDVIEATGGNPGFWLHQPYYDTFAPILDSAWGASTPFAGDYRAQGVSQIGIDAVTINNSYGSSTGFQFALLLRDTNGTPANFEDDDYAYAYFEQCPLVGEGWVHYDFGIPSQETDPVPPGWTGGYYGDLESFRPGVDWNDVITSVDRVEFWWIHPAWAAMFQQWDVGADNISITFGGGTPVEDATWGSIKALYQ
jgi:hypothetical protein